MLAEKCGKFAVYASVILRVALAAVLIAHGYAKLLGGIGGTSGFLAGIGFPAASGFAVAITAIEFFGGILLLLGLLTRLVSLLVVVQFIVIVLLKVLPSRINSPFIGGWELDFLMLAAALALLLMGSSKLSLEHALFKKELL